MFVACTCVVAYALGVRRPVGWRDAVNAAAALLLPGAITVLVAWVYFAKRRPEEAGATVTLATVVVATRLACDGSVLSILNRSLVHRGLPLRFSAVRVCAATALVAGLAVAANTLVEPGRFVGAVFSATAWTVEIVIFRYVSTGPRIRPRARVAA